MIEKRLLSLLVLISFSVSAQVKGVVKDSISGNPIAYVNIWVENENIGTTSEENGEFSINSNEKSKNLIFSALGFEKKIIKASMATEVKLSPTALEIEEVVISKRFGTTEVEIGKTKSEIYQAFDNGPRIDTKFFAYNPSYKKTKFIKKVTIFTDSGIEEATIKIHFYSVDSNGFPSEELLDKDFIVSVKKGVKRNLFDVTEFNLRMPKNGIFIGFEKLIIEKNKIEKTVTDLNKNTTLVQKIYFPFVLYNYVEREFLYTFYGGKWNRQSKDNHVGPSDKMSIYEPVINLILTN
jgi:hypothetical protein